MQKRLVAAAFFILTSRTYAQMKHAQSLKSLTLDEKYLKSLYLQFLERNCLQKNTEENKRAYTIMLSGAVIKNDIKKVKECIAQGADVNGCCDMSKEPYLICALEKKFIDIAKLLLAQDHTVNAAWGYAARTNRDDLMKQLHEMGAVTAMHDTHAAWRAIRSHQSHVRGENSNKSLAYLLSHGNVDIYSTREGLTLFEYAIINNQIESLAVLLPYVTEPEFLRKALAFALNSSNKQLVDLLVASPYIYTLTEKLEEGPIFDADKCYTYASTNYSSDCATPSEVQSWDGNFSSGGESGYEPSYRYASPKCIQKKICTSPGNLLEENSFAETVPVSSCLPKNP